MLIAFWKVQVDFLPVLQLTWVLGDQETPGEQIYLFTWTEIQVISNSHIESPQSIKHTAEWKLHTYIKLWMARTEQKYRFTLSSNKHELEGILPLYSLARYLPWTHTDTDNISSDVHTESFPTSISLGLFECREKRCRENVKDANYSFLRKTEWVLISGFIHIFAFRIQVWKRW